MLVIMGVLLIAAVTVLVVRKINDRSGRLTDEDDDYEAPPTWEETEDLRYGAEEDDDYGWREDSYEQDSTRERRPSQHIPELDDPDRR